jgi:hypothetical protein
VVIGLVVVNGSRTKPIAIDSPSICRTAVGPVLIGYAMGFGVPVGHGLLEYLWLLHVDFIVGCAEPCRC